VFNVGVQLDVTASVAVQNLPSPLASTNAMLAISRLAPRLAQRTAAQRLATNTPSFKRTLMTLKNHKVRPKSPHSSIPITHRHYRMISTPLKHLPTAKAATAKSPQAPSPSASHPPPNSAEKATAQTPNSSSRWATHVCIYIAPKLVSHSPIHSLTVQPHI
jgi:hypothetical protein